MMDAIATVYFVDVGQGTSQVILFRDMSVVVVDCGSSATAILRLLESIEFDRIRAIVLSHWHEDHVGGAPAVIDEYLDRIDRVYIPQDRPAYKLLENRIFQKINEASNNRKRFPIDKLLYNSVVHGKIWSAAYQEDRATLSVLYPDAVEEIEAQEQGDANQGSGILVLNCNQSRVLFPGDSGKTAFQAVVNRLGNGESFKCDVIAAPHHSGKLARGGESFPGYKDCYEWLYSSVLSTSLIVVSTGTGNNHDHPRPSHLSAAIQSGARVMCTQLTSQCHDDPIRLLPAVLEPCLLPASCSNGNGVGCAGTIQVDVAPSGVEIHRLNEHQEAINHKLDSKKALCRRLCIPS